MFNDHPSSFIAGPPFVSQQISFPSTQAKRVPKYLIFSYIGWCLPLNGRFYKDIIFKLQK